MYYELLISGQSEGPLCERTMKCFLVLHEWNNFKERRIVNLSESKALAVDQNEVEYVSMEGSCSNGAKWDDLLHKKKGDPKQNIRYLIIQFVSNWTCH